MVSVHKRMSNSVFGFQNQSSKKPTFAYHGQICRVKDTLLNVLVCFKIMIF